jgi:hypothetical protein
MDIAPLMGIEKHPVAAVDVAPGKRLRCLSHQAFAYLRL